MKKAYLSAVPYLYFIAILSWIFFGNWMGEKTGGSSIGVLLFTMPFFVQIFLKSKPLDLFLIAICTLFTSWMLLAYLSDVMDITAMTDGALRFIIIGGLFSVGNILMTGWLFFNLRNREKEQDSNLANNFA
ncbi:MAG: hypothetical protein R2788_15295 [Saprospiraceae bacterium]